MEYFPPEEERRYDFLEKITEAESIVGRSEGRIDQTAREKGRRQGDDEEQERQAGRAERILHPPNL